MDSREAYVGLNMIQGLGPVTVRALVSALGSPAAVFQSERAALSAVPGVGREMAEKIAAQRHRVDLAREIGRAEKQGFGILTPVDAAYPERLKDIHDPPLALYVWGSLSPRDRHAIAVVGCRRATHYGLAAAENLSCQLAQAGFTIVSGLARGIDAAAHRGALRGGGRTVAVLGGALDCLYPPENADLARQISAQGAVLSEFPLGREPDKTTFPVRNRIVSGMSAGVVVIEAGLASGAMITAHAAVDQGRAVFAVPGRIDSPASHGCHRLIKEGARLVDHVDDILEELGLLIPRAADTPVAAAGKDSARPQPEPPLSGEEQTLLDLLREEERVDVDGLTRMSGLGAAAVSSALLGLEMKRMVRVLPGRMVEIRR